MHEHGIQHIELLEKNLHYAFKDRQLLVLALSHKSYANEQAKAFLAKGIERIEVHNERLEFLGDAVLGLVISDLLYESFPTVDEGKLSKMRSSLVRAHTLAMIARELDLGQYVLLGKGEQITQGQNKDSILSATYEAILGAIYLEAGLPEVYQMVQKHFAKHILEADSLGLCRDYKTRLQELSQARFRRSPNYKIMGEEGPDHEKMFEVLVSVGALKRYGKGRSKKAAEQSAAQHLFEYLLQHQGDEVDLNVN